MITEKSSDEKYCSECSEIIKAKAVMCVKCGCRQGSGYGASLIDGEKSKTVATLLALLLGGIGMHKFYLGKPGAGILYIVFSLTFIPAIIALFEGIGYAMSSDEKFQQIHGIS